MGTAVGQSIYVDMRNGLRIKLNKFRRQASDGTPLDFDHFQFVGSIYPGKS